MSKGSLCEGRYPDNLACGNCFCSEMGVLAAAFVGDDCEDHVCGCLVAGQALVACSLVCEWFSPVFYFNGVLGYHLSSLLFCKKRFVLIYSRN